MRKQKAFTLIEIICVLAIAAIIAAAAVPGVSRYIDHTKRMSCKANMNSITDDIRYETVSRRFQDSQDLNTEIENIIKKYSDSEPVFSEITDEKTPEYIKISCTDRHICPNNGDLSINWTIKNTTDSQKIQLDLECACSCLDKDDKCSVSAEAMLKGERKMDYYEYLCNTAQKLYDFSSEYSKSQINSGQTKYDIAASLTGKLEKNKKVYLYRDSSSSVYGTQITHNSTIASFVSSNGEDIGSWLNNTADNTLWGVTVNDKGDIEWLSYYTRYIDESGTSYSHFIVVENGTVTTTKDDYYNLTSAKSKSWNPPAEGTLGSASDKCEWSVSGGKGVQTVGVQMKFQSSPTHWTQRDSDWYVQGWGIYLNPNFGNSNIYSQRTLSDLNASYNANSGAFSIDDSLIISACYNNGDHVVLSQINTSDIDTIDYGSGSTRWYLTNGYIAVDSVNQQTEWIGNLSTLKTLINKQDKLIKNFVNGVTDELIIAYQEYNKYTDNGVYKHEPVTKYCVLHRVFTGKTKINYETGKIEGQFSIERGYYSSSGKYFSAETIATNYESVSPFTEDSGTGYYFTETVNSKTREFYEDELLKRLDSEAVSADIYYRYTYIKDSVATVKSVKAGHIENTLTGVNVTLNDSKAAGFYVDVLNVKAVYTLTVTDSIQNQEKIYENRLKTIVHHSMAEDGFYLTFDSNSKKYEALISDTGDDEILKTLVSEDNVNKKLYVVYKDVNICAGMVVINTRSVTNDFVYYRDSSVYDLLKIFDIFYLRELYGDEVYIDEYLGNDTDVVVPYTVLGFYSTTPVLDFRIKCTKIRNGLYYIDDGQLYHVSRFGKTPSNDTTDGYSWEDNGPKCKVKNLYNVRTISFSEGINDIGAFAFYGYGNIVCDINIPASVEVIGRMAFRGTGITGVNFEENGNINTIYSAAFGQCANLQGYINIPDNISSLKKFTFEKCVNITGFSLGKSLEFIGTSAFSGCTGVTENLIIPDTVNTIEDSAFINFGSGLEDIYILGGSSNNGTKIDSNRFSNLKVKNLYVGGKVATIGNSVFSGFKGITGTLSFGDSVTNILNNAFASCTNISGDLVLPETIKQIGSGAFSNFGTGSGSLKIYGGSADAGKTISSGIFTQSRFRNIEIGGNVESIGGSAFAYITTLKGNLTIDDTVTKIGSSAFSGCAGLDGQLYLSTSLTSINDSAFDGCAALKGSLNISHNVRNIGSNAFRNCWGFDGDLIFETDITDDTLEMTGVSSIGSGAFTGCSGFTGDLVIPQTVKSIGNGAFSSFGSGTGQLGIYGGSAENGAMIGSGIFTNSVFNGISIGGKVTHIGANAFDNSGGAYKKLTGLLSLDTSVEKIDAYAFRKCSGLTGNPVIPQKMTSVSDSTFEDCSGLTGNLIISDNITSIGTNAFRGCRGFSGDLIIPVSVTVMKSGAFSNFGDGTGRLLLYGGSADSGKTIGNDIFTGSKFRDLYIGGNISKIGANVFNQNTNITGKLTIDKSVTDIGASAFSGCSGFTGDLLIPESVKSMGSNAFANFGKGTGKLTLHGGSSDSGKTIGSGIFTNSAFIDVTIGGNITNIASSAFNGNTKLTGTLTIEPGIQSIGSNAFYKCYGFTGSLTIPSTVTLMGDSCFSNFGQYGGDRNMTGIDISKPSMDSLYCYAKVDKITNQFGYTHFDNIILIDGAKDFATASFVGQSCKYMIILSRPDTTYFSNADALGRCYSHPKMFFGDGCIAKTNPFSHTRADVPGVYDHFYNQAVCIPDEMTGSKNITLESGDKKFTYLKEIYTHSELKEHDPEFYDVICSVLNISTLDEICTCTHEVRNNVAQAAPDVPDSQVSTRNITQAVTDIGVITRSAETAAGIDELTQSAADTTEHLNEQTAEQTLMPESENGDSGITQPQTNCSQTQTEYDYPESAVSQKPA
ncbi:MAG: leucine-rich repeat domain-containing protein [Oscillospiraceae bacterium]|nr:leucine-rich repeat domain-containing protein [Oscillospiraceae bacterium]